VTAASAPAFSPRAAAQAPGGGREAALDVTLSIVDDYSVSGTVRADIV
jgi:hypothetical protein